VLAREAGGGRTCAAAKPVLPHFADKQQPLLLHIFADIGDIVSDIVSIAMDERSEAFETDGEISIPQQWRDLVRKYRNVGTKVEQVWRAFTPKQREEAMREAVGDGKVLENSRDPGLGRLRDFLPDWNLEDITSTPDFFLERLKFRVENNLQTQIFEGS